MDINDGQIPVRAVLGGLDLSGEKIYVGRIKRDNGALLTGKIVPSHQTCYVAFDGAEYGSSEYQVKNIYLYFFIDRRIMLLSPRRYWSETSFAI